ncbi:MAG: aspartate--tRNA ligase [Chlamydiota bacterium]
MITTSFSTKRSHYCHALNRSHIGETVTLVGWVHRRRDHGSLIFIDLRDRFGITQLIFDPTIDATSHSAAAKLRAEWVIAIQGKVRSRGEGLNNPKLATGEVEVEVKGFALLSSAKTPPFSICDETTETHEDLRLKYRYLDIRRGKVADNLSLRHRAMMVTRNYFDSQGFLDIATPILARSTPEGARDYLVPSRIYPGNFYALPQSPQIFKQLLMIAGMDRYFQIAPCFRDEDLRADRQPEFTQLDIEMSFASPETIKNLIHNYLKTLFSDCIQATIPDEIPEMSYYECLEHYGTDRPDLRFEMHLHRLDDLAKQSTFGVFLDQLQTGGCIKSLCVKGGATLSRKEIDRYTSFVSNFGLKGLAWMKFQAGELSSSIVKFFPQSTLQELTKRMGAEEGDLLLFAAANESVVNQALDHLRRLIAKERNLIDHVTYSCLWVVDFPLFERDPIEKTLKSIHHPFTQPHPKDLPLLDSNPTKVRSLSYDIVINGYEVGGGSQRIHDFSVQQKIFQLLQLQPEEIQEKFGFFTEALQYGTPPHLGIALGIERLMMLLAKTDNIRDVIAFPKTQKASDLMMQCPEQVKPAQLEELDIQAEPKQISWL